jgi:hypothetical protein
MLRKRISVRALRLLRGRAAGTANASTLSRRYARSAAPLNKVNSMTLKRAIVASIDDPGCIVSRQETNGASHVARISQVLPPVARSYSPNDGGLLAPGPASPVRMN